jgi:hypothetical protein
METAQNKNKKFVYIADQKSSAKDFKSVSATISQPHIVVGISLCLFLAFRHNHDILQQRKMVVNNFFDNFIKLFAIVHNRNCK